VGAVRQRRLDLLEGVRTLQWSGLHPSHASGITDTLIPHAKTSYYEGIGHTPFREHPDRFNAELRAFASSL
jgi:pimeloyl-ACP methyl ester carboxylesterase